MNEHEESNVQLTVEDAIDAFRDLNEYVVSLDRILSRIGTGGQDPEILLNYMIDRDVFRRLTKLRAAVGDALESVLGEDEVDRIGEESYRYTD